jgi:hypothetical protein
MKYISFDFRDDKFIPFDHPWSFQAAQEVANHNFEQISFSESRQIDDKYLVVIEPSGGYTHIFDSRKQSDINILKVLKNDLKNETGIGELYQDLLSKKCNVFFLCKESSCLNTELFFLRMNELCEDLNLDKKQFYFLIPEFYINDYKSNEFNILWYPYYIFNMFWWSMKRTYKVKQFYDTYMEYSKCFLRQKHFVSTNNRARGHRTWLLFIFSKNNLLDKGYISYLVNNNDSDNQYSLKEVERDIRHIYEEYEPEGLPDEDTIKEFYKKLPIECDTKSDTLIQTRESNIAIQGVLLHSYFNVVTEAEYGFGDNFLQSVFLTEKIWKPILAYQPFIIVTNSYYLKALKELGFKTFSPFIDETYDEVHGYEKLKLIEVEINRLCNMSIEEIDKWYWEMEDILVYNCNHLIEIVEKSVDDIHSFLSKV